MKIDMEQESLIIEDVVKNNISIPANGIYYETINLPNNGAGAPISMAFIRVSKTTDVITPVCTYLASSHSIRVMIKSFYSNVINDLGITVRVVWKK